MSSRFHQKFHRFNHHSDPHPDPRFPDSSHDPIASPLFPFRGPFVLNGSLSSNSDVTFAGPLQVNDLVVFNTTNLQGPVTLDSSLVVQGNVEFQSNLTLVGSLSVLGDISYISTLVSVTSSFSIFNTGTVAALSVVQTGDVPVAVFRDDQYPALFIEGDESTPGVVGIGTEFPTTTLDVSGSGRFTGFLGTGGLSATNAQVNILHVLSSTVTNLTATNFTSISGVFSPPLSLSISNSAISLPMNSGNRMVEIVAGAGPLTMISGIKKGVICSLANMDSAPVTIWPSVNNIYIRGGAELTLHTWETCTVTGVGDNVASIH